MDFRSSTATKKKYKPHFRPNRTDKVIKDPETFDEKVGAELRKLRISRNLSRPQLAQILFVTRQTICNLERGATKVHLQHLYQYCKYFKVKASDILPF